MHEMLRESTDAKKQKVTKNRAGTSFSLWQCPWKALKFRVSGFHKSFKYPKTETAIKLRILWLVAVNYLFTRDFQITMNRKVAQAVKHKTRKFYKSK